MIRDICTAPDMYGIVAQLIIAQLGAKLVESPYKPEKGSQDTPETIFFEEISKKYIQELDRDIEDQLPIVVEQAFSQVFTTPSQVKLYLQNIMCPEVLTADVRKRIESKEEYFIKEVEIKLNEAMERHDKRAYYDARETTKTKVLDILQEWLQTDLGDDVTEQEVHEAMMRRLRDGLAADDNTNPTTE